MIVQPWASFRLGATLLLRAAVLTLCILSALFQALGTADHLMHSQADDLAEFLRSGNLALDGGNPYALHVPHHFPPGLQNANLNPPPSLLLFAPLAMLGEAGVPAFQTASVAAILLGVAALRPVGLLRLAWLAAFMPAYYVVLHGQVYGLLFGLLAFAWVARDRRPFLAGVLLGLAASIKPQFALWPALLLLRGERRLPLGAAVGCLFPWILSLLLFGPGTLPAWLEAQRVILPDRLHEPLNGSLGGLLFQLGLGPLAGIAPAVVLLGLTGWVWLKRPACVDQPALIASVLCAPIAWAGYGLFLLPVLLGRRWGLSEGLAAALLAVPYLLLLALNDGAPALTSLLVAAPALLLAHHALVIRMKAGRLVATPPAPASTDAVPEVFQALT